MFRDGANRDEVDARFGNGAQRAGIHAARGFELLPLAGVRVAELDARAHVVEREIVEHDAVGVGREGFQWQGLVNITRKAEWPDWTPPSEMIARQPYLPRFMAGGPGNPLGARAMYLGTTVYRIHGTNRPDTIGTAVSSGCFRLVNTDVADLYERVPVGTKVVIRQKPEL